MQRKWPWLLGVVLALGLSAWYLTRSDPLTAKLAEYGLATDMRASDGNAILGALGRKAGSKEARRFERATAPVTAGIPRQVVPGLRFSRNDSIALVDLALRLGHPQLGAASEQRRSSGFGIVVVQIEDPLLLGRRLDSLASADAGIAHVLADSLTRIVDAVGIVYSHADSVATTTRVSGTASTANAEIAVGSGGSTVVSRAIADSTIVFYRISRLCWSSHGRLARLRYDLPKGVKGREKCPPGTSPARPRSATLGAA